MAMQVGDKVRVKKSARSVIGESLSHGPLRRYVVGGSKLVVARVDPDFLVVGISDNRGQTMSEIRDYAQKLKIKEENLELW
jgi:hypothetical protein